MDNGKLPSLNGLRATSILLVILSHLEFTQHIISKNVIDNAWVTHFITDGNLGVNIFFVISGFLICSLLLAEEKVTHQVSLKNFYRRRMLRIFPAYYFLLLVYFILQLIGVLHIDASSWVTALTFTKYFNWQADWFTGHGWSLSIEEQFYLCWPMIFLLENKTRKLIAFFILLAVPCIRLYSHYFPAPYLNELTLFYRIDSIVTGCLLAFYKDELLKLLHPHFKLAFYFSIAGLFIVDNLSNIGQLLHLHLGFIIVPLGSTYGTLANLCIAVIVLYSVFGAQGIWFTLLNSKIMNYLGVLSYSLYLWQQLFFTKLNPSITSFPQNIIFIFVAALISYYLIERPFLKWKEQFKPKNGKALV